MRGFAAMRWTIGLFALFALMACVPVGPGGAAMSSRAPRMTAPGDQGPPVLAPPVAPPTDLQPTAPVPAISSAAAVVMDGVTGRILAQKNADEHRAVASTQKLMTALLTLEAGPLSDPVTVVTSDTQVEPSKVYILPDETYTRVALVKALMVKSGNDVAKALARDVAGSEAAFVSRMNSRAVALGMMNSNFRNPHGLTEDGQYSTARDIAILAREAYQSAVLRSFVSTKSYTFTRPSGKTKTLNNTNKLLSRVSYCTGMKTGTTNASGNCLVSSGDLDGRIVIVVVLGAQGETMLYKDSENLLRWGLEREGAAN